jgi:hypothetical protein
MPNMFSFVSAYIEALEPLSPIIPVAGAPIGDMVDREISQLLKRVRELQNVQRAKNIALMDVDKLVRVEAEAKEREEVARLAWEAASRSVAEYKDNDCDRLGRAHQISLTRLHTAQAYLARAEGKYSADIAEFNRILGMFTCMVHEKDQEFAAHVTNAFISGLFGDDDVMWVARTTTYSSWRVIAARKMKEHKERLEGMEVVDDAKREVSLAAADEEKARAALSEAIEARNKAIQAAAVEHAEYVEKLRLAHVEAVEASQASTSNRMALEASLRRALGLHYGN